MVKARREIIRVIPAAAAISFIRMVLGKEIFITYLLGFPTLSGKGYYAIETLLY